MSKKTIVKKIKNRARHSAARIVNYLKYERPVELDASQWWSYEKLKKFQEKRLRKIIRYAYETIPAYRRKFIQAGITPRDIRKVEDLCKIPVTTRQEMQNNPDFVNSKLIKGTLYTGGSTGTTLRYFDSFEGAAMLWQTHLRGWRWNGYEYGRKKLAVVTSAQGVVEGENTLNLSGDLSEPNIRKNLKKILEFRPQYLRGYVSSLYILARYCLDHSVEIDFVESINTISENLYDFQRQAMEQAFGGKVFEEYVCNDGGACAWECNCHQGLHYNMERAVIEEIDGEMLVTDLWNKAMPFIRYKNGDSVTFLNKQCKCGRQLPLIKVKGRANDILIGRNGPVSPSFLIHHGIGLTGVDKKNGKFYSGIGAVQYVQKPEYKLQVNMVKNDFCTDRDVKQFYQNINEIVGDMEVEVCPVATIPATSKGKRQFIINEDKGLLKQWGYRC